MNTERQRRINLPYPKKGPNGERYCRWCKGEIPKNSSRRNWCGQKCVDEYLLRNDPSVIRRKVFARDKGVCARCGIDTEAERKRIRALRDQWHTDNPWLVWREHNTPGDIGHYYKAAAAVRGEWPSGSRSWWEADHILEVVNGGAELGLENLQTLCVPCHRRKTAELAKARAVKRRAEKASRQLQLLNP